MTRTIKVQRGDGMWERVRTQGYADVTVHQTGSIAIGWGPRLDAGYAFGEWRAFQVVTDDDEAARA